MSTTQTAFDQFIAAEISKYNGISMPLKASFWECLLIRREKCDRLHPNPTDEFCMPEVGPSYRIISEYEKKIRDALEKGEDPVKDWDEPIMVEKMYPDGYQILNGHHRWAAAMRTGLKKVPVSIINPTHEADIREMLANSTHEKRVTFDLDEVVFRDENSTDIEKPLMFPFHKLYPERIRRGFPALCHYLSTRGYDIWVYTCKLYSTNYIKKLFRRNHVQINGVITAIGKTDQSITTKKNIEKMFAQKYPVTVNVDEVMVLSIDRTAKSFRQFDLTQPADRWAAEVRSIFEETDSHEP